ncbi:MAG: DUF1580 domain-containing protein [Planctomycetes bacterium]|nr:DUF1580 domain-containing protein [Planctomycetota bacterium]
MISLDERTLSLPEAAKFVPRRRAGRKVATSTLYRWITRGVRGVRLESMAAGGGLVTSREALERFFATLTALRRPAPRTAAQDASSANSSATTLEADRVFGPRVA